MKTYQVWKNVWSFKKACLNKLKSLYNEQQPNLELAKLLTQRITYLTPLPIIELKDITIFRARIDEMIPFNQEWQLSYNERNTQNISLGRFNYPHQGLFYGSINIVTVNSSDPFLAAVFECDKTILDQGMFIPKANYTVGEFKLNTPAYFISFLLNEKWLKHLPDAQKFEYKTIQVFDDFDKDKKEFIKEWALFLAEKSCADSDELTYSITSEFYNFITDSWNSYKINGIVYPSKLTDYKTVNIVLNPEFCCKQNVNLNRVLTLEYYREGKEFKNANFTITSIPSIPDKDGNFILNPRIENTMQSPY